MSTSVDFKRTILHFNCFQEMMAKSREGRAQHVFNAEQSPFTFVRRNTFNVFRLLLSALIYTCMAQPRTVRKPNCVLQSSHRHLLNRTTFCSITSLTRPSGSWKIWSRNRGSVQLKDQQMGKKRILKNFRPPGKICWVLFKNFWAPLGKLFAPPSVPSWLRAWQKGMHITGKTLIARSWFKI